MDAEIVAIASRGSSDVKATRDALGINYILIPGPLPGVMREYDVYNERVGVARPATVIVDRSGAVRWRYVGRDDNDCPRSPAVIEQLRRLQ